MRKISDIYGMIDASRQRIIETMRERNITKVTFVPDEETYESEHEGDPEAQDYYEFRDENAPCIIHFDKYNSGNEYFVMDVELTGGEHPRFKMNCDGEFYDCTFYDDDVAWLTLINVYECLEKVLELAGEPEKVWLVKQESNVDGKILFNVTPCKDKETAAKVVFAEIHTLLTAPTPYLGALDYIEGRKEVDDDCPFSWDGKLDGSEGFYISTSYGEHYEQILIEEEEIK